MTESLNKENLKRRALSVNFEKFPLIKRDCSFQLRLADEFEKHLYVLHNKLFCYNRYS